jgi:hypothetical protein
MWNVYSPSGSSDASPASTSSRSSRFAIQLVEAEKASTSSRLERCSCSTSPSWISPKGVPSKRSSGIGGGGIASYSSSSRAR